MVPAFPSRLVLASLLLAVAPTRAADWQWSVPLPAAEGNAADSRAFLWIPPDAPHVRAVVLAQQGLGEGRILEQPALRAALRELGFAAVWLAPSIDRDFAAEDGLPTSFDRTLRALADESGYAELAFAPVVPLGHAAAAMYPWLFARAHPARTLAVISLNGQWPYGDAVPAGEAIDPALNGIPGLVVLGEYEWASERAATGLAQRAVHPGIPLTFLAEAAGGHFDLSSHKLGYLALYLRKVAANRLPPDEGRPYAAAVPLRYVDPLAGGWLVDRWRGDEPPRVPAAPLEEYAEPEEAFWCFDQEHAVATEKFRPGERGKRVALLGFLQDGAVLPQEPGTHEQVLIPFRPSEDGVSFQLGAAFLDRVPPGRPKRWTGLRAGAAVSRPATGEPIVIDLVGGPGRKRDQETFSLHFDRSAPGARNGMGELWLVATHAGDSRHKGAVQQAALRFPLRNGSGAPQRITFPAIPDLRSGAGPIRLGATSDSGLQVGYYVREGPAVITGDTLALTALPTRARQPLRVTVVAWQYGRASAPAIQSAAPVERTFAVTR